MKLISMTDFVLLEGNPSNTDSQFADKVMAYANFLKQPLTLGMFIPCDENNDPLIEPKEENYSKENNLFAYDLFEYKKAKEKVLFNGFEIQKQGGEYLVKYEKKPVWVNWNNSKIIEDLVYLRVDCAVSF